MKLGHGAPDGARLRLPILSDLGVCLAIMNVLHEGLGDTKYRVCPLLKKMVAAGRLGKKSGKCFISIEMAFETLRISLYLIPSLFRFQRFHKRAKRVHCARAVATREFAALPFHKSGG